MGGTQLRARLVKRDPLLYTLSGEIDVASALPQPTPGRRLVVDASSVTFAGSALLSWLVAAKADAAGFVLRKPAPEVLRLLRVSGLLDEFVVQVS